MSHKTMSLAGAAFLSAALSAVFLPPRSGFAAETPAPALVEISSRSIPIPDTRSSELGAGSTEQVKLQILEVFRQGSTTKMILQSNRLLISGRDVYVGVNEVAVGVGALLTRMGGLYYYGGSVSGRPGIDAGDVVRLEPSRRLSLPAIISAPFSPKQVFSEKYRGEITVVQGDRAMIDKGTLQEVHERDMYKVFDPSGRYKGMLEIRGIGDLQSSGKLYNRWEDRRRKAVEVAPGDQVRFVGQRMRIGLGAVIGARLARDPVLYSFDRSGGGGVLWNATFFNGWGVELLVGAFTQAGEGRVQRAELVGGVTIEHLTEETRRARYIAPIWIKKSFFYPSVASPFVAAGFSYFDGLHTYRVFTGPDQIGGEERKRSVAPVLGVGIEFFPTRLVRPRLEIRRFYGPALTVLDNRFYTAATYYSFGLMTAW